MKKSPKIMATTAVAGVCAFSTIAMTAAHADTNNLSISGSVMQAVQNNIDDQENAGSSNSSTSQATATSTSQATASSTSSPTNSVVVTTATATATKTITATATTTPTATTTSSASPTADTTPTVLNLNTPALRCEVKSGDSHLQDWPAKVRSRIEAQFGITDIGGYRTGANAQDHATGEALDVMVPKVSAEGDEIATWVLHNYKSLHIKYVIWKQHIWAPYRMYWRPMNDRGDMTQNHYDLVHISFLAGEGTCPTN